MSCPAPSPASAGLPAVTGPTAGTGRTRRSGRTAARATLALALGAGALSGTLAGTAGATGVPATPAGLPAGVEDLQPYVGQEGCDPVAKPGVSAFQRLLMDTYRDTGSLGIVRDCGIGGQSEHKEGRALDWAVSVNNPNHVAEVNAVTGWLTATVNGVPYANARRFGIMYMIWNHRIWKAYQADRGWQAYTGPIPHTDHVHFSFGWNGAKQATSWWTKRVAPVDYGPYVAAPPTTPVPSPDNLRILAAYGASTVGQGASGPAVVLVQTAVGAVADGDFGPATAADVRTWQTAQRLPVTGVFGPADWLRAFPRPVNPFGAVESGSDGVVRGWVADADTTGPLAVQVLVDGAPGPSGTATAARPDLAGPYPGVTARGFAVPVDVGTGSHQVCVVATNVGPGVNGPVGCVTATSSMNPVVAAAINAKYDELGGAGSFLGPRAGTAVNAAGGTWQPYAGGTIFWSPATGAHEVHGAVLAKYLEIGGPAGFAGFPVTDELTPPDGVGRYNYFSRSASIYWSPSTGAHELHGDVLAAWAAGGWESGPSGYPTTDELATPDGVGRYNAFTNDSSIYWTPTTGAHELRGAVRAEWAAMGWEAGMAGYPLVSQAVLPDGVGQYVPFSGGVSIYWTPQTGAHEIHGQIRDAWAATGWESGPLGYPRTDETLTPDGGGRYNGFTGSGVIYWSAANGAHPVTGRILSSYQAAGGAPALGMPLGDVHVVGPVSSQDFDRATISWNSTTGSVTVRPRP